MGVGLYDCTSRCVKIWIMARRCYGLHRNQIATNGAIKRSPVVSSGPTRLPWFAVALYTREQAIFIGILAPYSIMAARASHLLERHGLFKSRYWRREWFILQTIRWSGTVGPVCAVNVWSWTTEILREKTRELSITNV